MHQEEDRYRCGVSLATEFLLAYRTQEKRLVRDVSTLVSIQVLLPGKVFLTSIEFAMPSCIGLGHCNIHIEKLGALRINRASRVDDGGEFLVQWICVYLFEQGGGFGNK